MSRLTGYTCYHKENALHRAYRAKVTKHYEWLQAKNYWFVPVVAATSGALHPETLRLLYDFARLKTDAAEQHAVANSLRSPLTPEQLCQRRGATFARLRDGGPAVQPPGLSYTAHWEALGCALCLLTTPEISSTGPVRGRGFCPGSHRPRARVPLVVWAWDFLLCGFLAAVSRPLLSHCFSLCDLRLFVNKRMLLPRVLRSCSNAFVYRPQLSHSYVI